MSWVITGAQKVNWDPSLISTALWLDADDFSTITLNGGTVSEWRDKSGNNRHASQATSANQPTYAVAGFNGKPTIDFDGTDDQLDLVQFAQVGGQNIWMVADTTSLGTGFRVAMNRTLGSANNLVLLFGYAVGDFRPVVYWNGNQSFWASAVQRKAIVRWSFYSGTPATSLVQVDGATAVSKTFTASALSDWNSVNSGSLQQSNVNISEVIMTPSDLSTDNRQKLEGYLAHKWGLTANLPADHPYKTAVPVP